MTDLMDRLRAADPVPDPVTAPPIEWLVPRLQATTETAPRDLAAEARPGAPRESAPADPAAPRDPAPAGGATSCPPGRPRLRRRLRVLVPVFAAALAAAVVVLLGRGSSPDVVAEARAALGAPGEIVHTIVRTQQFDENGKAIGQSNVEQWAALDPLRTRTRMTITPAEDGTPRMTESDYADGVFRSAWSWDDYLREHKLSPEELAGYVAANTGSESALDAGADPVAGVRALLAGGKLAPAGETEVNGRRVLLLRGDRPRRVLPDGRGVQLAVRVEYLVDAETYVPVQVTYRIKPSLGAGGAQTTRTTFETYERLPLAGNEALLRIPDADQRRVMKAHR
ncbi:hypothetical protein OM076_04195 [Solirubrobacter ginsenosidimutans]|uniref:Uncharacterized protein n=1 Tax=Solirubrobacter ginsenosidimutans TaxID=490573 RepID=A0A9X3MQQ1_9ACTN|nr:hypothetical protein [Solirubrobacter ginsenosidimutans]MDA0159455.1 hypothetical protein [Solirubrobacter ginsenosidimutans]